MNITRVLSTISRGRDRKIAAILRSLNAFTSEGPPEVLVTDTLKPGDPREWFSKLYVAQAKDINDLLEIEVMEVLPKKEVPERANILDGRFVLAF